MDWGSSVSRLKVTPSSFSSALSKPSFLEHPPVSVTSLFTPTRLTSELTRLATDLLIPEMMSGNGFSSLIRVITSDSAKTLHWLDMLIGLALMFAVEPMPSSPQVSTLAMTWKKRPVPAAQRSFISNWVTPPLSLRLIALQSCPPMSMMVRTVGQAQKAPRP